MHKDIADKWVAALRSGKYKQTKGVLKHEGAYCCLGVLCEVAGFEFDEANQINGEGISLPEAVRAEVGMYSDTGYIHRERSLTHLNDHESTFPQIADIIEKNWERL